MYRSIKQAIHDEFHECLFQPTGLLKQISQMGRKSKGTKKIVGSAAVGAARVEEADGASEEFAVEGMGLQALPTGADGGSSEETTSAAATIAVDLRIT